MPDLSTGVQNLAIHNKMKHITIQSTFTNVISDVRNGSADDSFWVTLDDTNEEHTVMVAKDPKSGAIVFTSHTAGFEQISDHIFKVTVGGSTYRLQTPAQAPTCGPSTPCELTALDVAPNVYATGDVRGCLTLNTQPPITVPGAHHADITDMRFFPSGQVLLSVGADLCARVWALDGTSPRTLVGHTARITACAMIGRGRNVLTGSRDGSIRLWECGSGGMVHEFRRIRDLADPVTSIVVVADPAVTPETPLSSQEFEVLGKYVFGGYESGIIQQYSVADRSMGVSFLSVDHSAVTCLAGSTTYSEQYVLFAGYENGMVRVWSLGETAPLQSFKVSDEPVTSLSVDIDLVVAGGMDKLVRFSLEGALRGEWDATWLVGAADSAVFNKVKQEGGRVYAVGKHGVVAIYA
ncbi:hypothetical protein BABINDRAFT_162183 [Babjeviella inositovora NRRL Y-12698]|uniref:Uncharacterized protein n=1 Tax=Babjeviella inositovora NRRL Y-12698 TaxID=984486 RepID=A0A1E3QN73_9ASCO|nr:uncharacterized protein BABINDRAFT_162183 [Babjeviella inositovora NRRL Y-12698]ODQ79121.1 hypothetical protein BABINDRAFT_162183 [Babjeviella inositovora NRRL Y-12698]